MRLLPVSLAVLLITVTAIAILNKQEEKKAEKPTITKTKVILPDPPMETGEAPAGFSPLLPFIELERLLPELVNQPIVGGMVVDIQKEIPAYKEIVTEAMKVAPGLQIDVIFQAHIAPGHEQDVEHLRSIIPVQQKIRAILEQEKYDLVGTEGSCLEKVTFESLIKEQEVAYKYMGKFDWHTPAVPSEEERRVIIMSKIESDGVLQYLQKKPEAYIFGYENAVPLSMHGTVIAFLNGSYDMEPKWRDTNEKASNCLRGIRSILPLARLVTKMKKEGLERGVLVIGYLHQELRGFCKFFKLDSKFFTVIPQ